VTSQSAQTFTWDAAYFLQQHAVNTQLSISVR